MSARSQELARKIKSFNDDMIAFVDHCPEDAWGRTCAEEDWTVGVVARHVAAGHFQVIHWAQSILKGETLPALTMDQVIEMGNAHARDHADCTRGEVRGLLADHGAAAIAFVSGLSDADLDCQGHLALVGGAVSVEQLLTYVIIQSGGQHLASMQDAIG
jgi:hypothetical protein